MEKTIYQLKLHETLKLPGGDYVTRVPGGWIYDIPCGGSDEMGYRPIFVPFDNEFQDDA